jgi:hypothetical protein
MYQDLVEQFNSGRFTKLKWARFKALLNCLSPDDACLCAFEMLQTEHDMYMREAFCKKLEVDISRTGWQECHTHLVDQLVGGIYYLSTTRSFQQYAFVLGELAGLEATPQLVRAQIVPHLLSSEFKSVRKYGYAALEKVEAEEFIEEIEAAWRKNGDTACARLIVNQLPVSIQGKHFDSLYELSDAWTLNKLYQKVSLSPDRLALLQELDGITYAYICAKRKVPITNADAEKLWARYSKDERAGLLIWCFGQLEMWNFLAAMEFGKPSTKLVR